MPFDLHIAYVSATEAKLGMSLPDEYIACMTRMNGGCASFEDEIWWLHPIFDDSGARRLKRTSNDVVRETREALSWSGFPDGALSIASNGSGDHLVFVPDRANARFRPAVYRWRHETAELVVISEKFDLLEWRPA